MLHSELKEETSSNEAEALRSLLSRNFGSTFGKPGRKLQCVAKKKDIYVVIRDIENVSQTHKLQ